MVKFSRKLRSVDSALGDRLIFLHSKLNYSGTQI